MSPPDFLPSPHLGTQGDPPGGELNLCNAMQCNAIQGVAEERRGCMQGGGRGGGGRGGGDRKKKKEGGAEGERMNVNITIVYVLQVAESIRSF